MLAQVLPHLFADAKEVFGKSDYEGAYIEIELDGDAPVDVNGERQSMCISINTAGELSFGFYTYSDKNRMDKMECYDFQPRNPSLTVENIMALTEAWTRGNRSELGVLFRDVSHRGEMNKMLMSNMSAIAKQFLKADNLDDSMIMIP